MGLELEMGPVREWTRWKLSEADASQLKVRFGLFVLLRHAIRQFDSLLPNNDKKGSEAASLEHPAFVFSCRGNINPFYRSFFSESSWLNSSLIASGLSPAEASLYITFPRPARACLVCFSASRASGLWFSGLCC